MTHFKPLTETFSVCAQLTVDDVKRAADAGYTAIICNRPDDEEAGQPNHQDIQNAAESMGLRYYFLPFKGPATPEIVNQTQEILKTETGPILAHCRSGTRSTNVWAVAAVRNGQIRMDDAIAAGREQGYDLSHLPERLAAFS